MYLGIADHGNGGKIIIGNEIKNWKNINVNKVKTVAYGYFLCRKMVNGANNTITTYIETNQSGHNINSIDGIIPSSTVVR